WMEKTRGAAGGPPGTMLQLYLASNPDGAQFVDKEGDPVQGPIEAVVKNGVATFSGVRLNKAGGYTLGVLAKGNDLLTPGNSNPFSIVAAPAAGIDFLVQPTYTGTTDLINAYNPRTFSTWPGVVVMVIDKFGNRVTGGFGASDEITIEARKGGTVVPFTMPDSAKAKINPETGVAVF